MPDKTSTAEAQTSLAPLTTKERLIAVPGKKSDPEDDERKQSREGAKRSKTGLLQSLKPLLPVLSSGLRLVDHGAVQALAHLLSLVDGHPPPRTRNCVRGWPIFRQSIVISIFRCRARRSRCSVLKTRSL